MPSSGHLVIPHYGREANMCDLLQSGAMCTLSSFFINNSTHIYCAVLVADLISLAQTHHYHHSLLPPLFMQTFHDVDHFGLDELRNN